MAPTEQEAKMAHPRMAAGALFFDTAGRVLMVEPTYKDYWEIPGGYVETGESPLHAAVREVQEELGIAPPLGRLLAVDWAPNQTEGDKVLYLSDGGRLDQDDLTRISLQTEELKSFAFFTPEQISEHTIPRLARRIIAATEARDAAAPVYLEHGQTPAPRRRDAPHTALPRKAPGMTSSPEPEPERVNSREDLAAFVRALHRNHAKVGRSWENADLPNVLEALSAWIDDADGWYRNTGREMPADGDWRFFARALMAATVYE